MAQLLRLINKIFELCKSIFNNLYRPNSINQGGVKAHWRQLPLQLIPHKELSCAINLPHLRWTQVGCDTCYAMAFFDFDKKQLNEILAGKNKVNLFLCAAPALGLQPVNTLDV
jgi:hypothetical protein